MKDIWDMFDLNPENDSIFNQQNNRESKNVSYEAASTGGAPEGVENAPEAEEAVETDTEDQFGSGEAPEPMGGSDSEEEAGDDSESDEGGGEGGGGSDYDDEGGYGDDDGGSFDSDEELELGDEPLSELHSKEKLITVLNELSGYIAESINIGAEKPNSSVVVKRLEGLKELVDNICTSAMIVNPADTMIRYELATQQYAKLVRKLKRI